MKHIISIIVLFSLHAGAADLTQIFGPESPTTPQVKSYITNWLTNNCKDLKWALSVTEIPERHESCKRGIEKVHLDVELSHMHSEMIFWVKNSGDRSVIDWIYEETPSWHICSYSEAYYRDDKTCRYYP